MKIEKSRPSAAKSAPRGFYELAKAHVDGQSGEWCVIERKNPAQAQQWRAWIAYFAWRDDQTVPRGHKATTFRGLEKLTVPSEWPLGFDANALPAPLPEPREEMPSPERRRQLAEMLRQLVAGLAMPGPPRARPFSLPVAEEKPLFADRPQVSTPDLAKYLRDMTAALESDEAFDKQA
jgi:hypothetical protein